jgi:hypothetical protein
MDFLTNVNLKQNQLLQARLQNLSTAPTSPTPVEGQMYYDTTSHRAFVYNNSTWVGMDSVGSAVADGSITLAKMANMATASFIGRKTAATGVPEILSKSDALTILNVADGANNYVHPSGDGNLHVPATGTTNSGNILIAGSTAGSAAWGTNAPAWSNVANKPTSSVSSIDGAVVNSHVQNTDTGTSSSTFMIGTGGSKLKNNSGEVQIRNNADTDYADLRVNNLVVMGGTTTINSNVVNIGDNEILLNSDVAVTGDNSDGGLAIKRLMADNVTLKNALLTFNNSTGKWQTTQGAVTTTLVTTQIANKVSAVIGDAISTSFVITHSLNSRELVVSIHETAGSYNVVYADIAMTSLDTITVSFAVAPTSNQYTVSIVG